MSAETAWAQLPGGAQTSSFRAQEEEEDALLFEALCDGGMDDASWSGVDAAELLGADAWAACSAAAAGAAAAASSTPSHSAASLHLYRCLDASHGAGPCGGCAPPPPPGAEGDYEILLGGSGARGQKALRAQLCRTREWNSAAARAQLAALCGGEDAALAAALMTKRSARLTKPPLLLLARAWGYASDLWRYHGRASRKRTQAQAQASAEAEADEDLDGHSFEDAAVPPRSARARLRAGGFAWGAALGGGDLGCAVTPAAVAAEVAQQLTPLSNAAAALLAGPAARRAASAVGAYFGAEEVTAVSAARDAFASAAAAWAAAAPAPALAANGAAPWAALHGGETGAEAALRALAAVLRRAANANCAVRYFTAPAVLETERAGLQAAMAADTAALFDPEAVMDSDDEVAARDEVVPPASALAGAAAEAVPPAQAAACAAWLREAYAGLVALAELCVRLQALLADSKLARSADAFAAADAAARGAAATACAAARDALAERLAWMAEAMMMQQAASPPPPGGAQQRRHRTLFAFPPAQAAQLPAPPR